LAILPAHTADETPTAGIGQASLRDLLDLVADTFPWVLFDL
jgi:hypothetical protein